MKLMEAFESRRERKQIISRCREIIRRLSVDFGARSIRLYDNLTGSRDYIRDTFAPGKRAALRGIHRARRQSAQCHRRSARRGTEERIILVGAHYDTIAGTPGADDNASAVAGLLELHRLLSPLRLRRTLRFVAFTLEEPPFFSTDLMGSMQNARNSRERGDNIELMVCLEMLGYAGRRIKQKFPFDDMKRDYPRCGNYLAVVALPSSAELAWLWRNLHNACSRRRVYEMIGPSSIPGIGYSDHMSYNRYNYRNLMLPDTAFFRNEFYHTEHDTIVNLANFPFPRRQLTARHVTCAHRDRELTHFLFAHADRGAGGRVVNLAEKLMAACARHRLGGFAKLNEALYIEGKDR
jgi:hypothetical protein